MKCTYCGSEIPQGSRFCTACGSMAPAQEPQQPQAAACRRCGAPLAPGSTFCNHCGALLSEIPVAPVPAAPAASRPGKAVKGKRFADIKKPLMIGGGVLAAVLVIVLLINLLGGLFGGPLASIAGAAAKTLDKGNLTFKLRMDDQKYTGMVNVNLKERDITLDVTYAESDGTEYRAIIYKGYAISQDRNGDWSCFDISDQLDQIFDYYEEYGNLDDLDLEKLLEEAGVLEQMEKYVELEKLEKCLVAYVKKLNNKGWLEENAGYSQSKEDGETLHTFEPNLYHFLSASLPEFQAAFADSDDYETVEDALKQGKSILRAMKAEVTIGVKGGVLSSLETEVDGDKIKLTVTDVGKTRLDTEELDKILKKAKGNGSGAAEASPW